MNTAREMLATAHRSMKKAAIAEHALMMASELEGLAEAITGQGTMLTSLAELVRTLKANTRAIDSLAKEGAAREALSALAAVPDIAPVPVAVFSPEWANAMFSPSGAQAH